MQPVFFATGQQLHGGMTDLERRETLALWMTASGDRWFAKAFVNRLWSELVGHGFYEPVDDMGPDREPFRPASVRGLDVGLHGQSLRRQMADCARSSPQRPINAKASPDTMPISRPWPPVAPSGCGPINCSTSCATRSISTKRAIAARAEGQKGKKMDGGGPGGRLFAGPRGQRD